VQDAAPESVDRPDHQNVEPSPHGILQHGVECRALIPAFGAADALVLVSLDDRPTAMLCDTLQDEALVLSRLIVAAHAQVDRSADAIDAHGSHFRARQIGSRSEATRTDEGYCVAATSRTDAF
jgi:hypothetical protein